MANEDLPSGCKRCKGCNQVKPFEEFGKELKGKFGLKSKCKLCISDKNRNYDAGSGAGVKLQNNKKYQTEHKSELAEKMRVRRAKKKFGDNYEAYLASLERIKNL